MSRRTSQLAGCAADHPAMSHGDISVATRVADLQARIATLQARFGAAPAPTSDAAPVSFDAALSTAVADAGGAHGAGGTRSTTAVAPAPVVGGDGSAGARAVALAKQQLGKPYVWGAQSPAVGFDCSGLVQHTFKQLGVDLPRVSRDQARAGRAVASLADARPGDLIAFGSPVDHIGIYAGGNKMVVAPRSGDVVKVQEIYRTPTAIRRVV